MAALEPVAVRTVADARPVLPGFHPDPTLCVADGWLWVASSSFELGPGVPLHRTPADGDLRTWELVGHVLTRTEQVDLAVAPSSNGILAPTLRHHDGRYWLITTNLADGDGHLLVHASDPTGEWSAPVRFPGLPGIDPDLAWDEKGRCLLTWAGFGPGGSQGLVQVDVDPSTGEVLSERRTLWRGAGGRFPEGPHLHRRGDWWYLVVAEGGTERGHAVTLARSRDPRGGFEAYPGNPFLTHRGTDRPVQSVGHADLAVLPDGREVMAFHGTRPRGASPEWHVLGRETYLVEVGRGDDGWPVLGAPVQPAQAPDAVRTEEVGDGPLPATWVTPHALPGDLVEEAAGGTPVLRPPAGEQAFVGRRQQHAWLAVTADLDVAGEGGLALRIDPWHEVSVERVAGHVRARITIGGLVHEAGALPDEGQTLELRVEPAEGPFWSVRLGPDTVRVGVRGPDGFVELARADGRYLSTEVAGGMTGRLVGVVARSGAVVIRRVRVLTSDDAAALAAAAG